jgi:hypothetical protein
MTQKHNLVRLGPWIRLEQNVELVSVKVCEEVNIDEVQ